MGYYIKHQVSEALKKKGTYYYIAGIIILCILANLAMISFRTIYGMNEGAMGFNLIYFAVWCFVIPYYTTILISEVIFGKECPNPRIKTKDTIGLSRANIYLGQFVAELIIGAFFVLLSIASFLGITYLFMASDGTIDLLSIEEFCQKAMVAVPLWITGVSIGHMFLYICKKKRYAFLSFYLLVLVFPRLIMFFVAKFEWAAFVWIKDVLLLTPRFDELPYFFTLNIPQIIILSIVYTAISTVIGLSVYYRKEF